MRALAYTFGFLVILVLGALFVGQLIDEQWLVQRDVQLEAPPSAVMADIAVLKNWPEWSAWTKENYPDMTYAQEGPASGVGAVQTWHDGAMNGRLEVTAYQPGKSLAYDLSMDDGEFEMQCMFNAEPSDQGTHLTWTCQGETDSSPVDKLLMRLFMPMMGSDFETGLNNLQARHAKDGA